MHQRSFGSRRKIGCAKRSYCTNWAHEQLFSGKGIKYISYSMLDYAVQFNLPFEANSVLKGFTPRDVVVCLLVPHHFASTHLEQKLSVQSGNEYVYSNYPDILDCAKSQNSSFHTHKSLNFLMSLSQKHSHRKIKNRKFCGAQIAIVRIKTNRVVALCPCGHKKRIWNSSLVIY